MILTEVQNYLKSRGKVSLSELSNHFRMDADALRPILKKLICKGRIRHAEAKKCGGCCECSPDTLEFYEWVNELILDRST